MDFKDVSKYSNSELIYWTGSAGQYIDEGEIVYTDNGERYLVNKAFITNGGNNQLNTEVVSFLVEYGDEVFEPKKERIETCIGDQWSTVKTGTSKTNLVNKHFGTVKRKTSFYSFSGSNQQSLSTSISGYGVTIKYAVGTNNGGAWGVYADSNRFSTVRNNVKGNIQRKQLSNCSATNRFVKTHEWATVHY